VTKMTEFEENLVAMLDELRDAPGIEVDIDNQGDIADEFGDAESAFQLVADWFDMPLRPSLQRCYMRFSQFWCHWRYEAEGMAFPGEMRMSYLLAALGTPTPPLASASSSTSERQLYEQLRVLDDRPESGTGALAAIRLQPSVDSPEIWYYDPAHGTFKMDVDYCQYLDAILVTKGTSGWQYLFTEAPLASREFVGPVTNLKSMLEVFPEVFPAHDYEPLRQRLSERL
jgi:hypothetical protein